ncbi:hypothetical protein FRC09_012766 [Ceratobasidium sp. 395]|nr:hypothetical protein FRC09_012766 [Ceratobasidium sp. 395]
MTTAWAGYRYSLFTFLMLNPAFVLILSAQNIETGRLVDGGKKSHVFTLIVSIFNTFFLGLVLWFDLTKRISIIAEVRWELIWTATFILFDIIGIASIASNRPASNTCTQPDSNWNVCSASGGIIALLILATLALAIHALTLIVMIVRQSGKTVLDVWSFIARELPYALERTPPPVDFAPGITSPSSENMAQLDPGRPKSLPPVPLSEIPPPPVAYGGYRDPFTFSSLLNSTPRQDPDPPKSYQLYDTPIPVARPPVQKSFERVSRSGSSSFGMRGSTLSGHFNPTPLYERFARGGRERDAPSPLASTPSPPVSPNLPRRKEGDFVFWHAMDEHVRRTKTQRERQLPPEEATTLERDPSATKSLPERTRRPPRILPGTLPNPNTHRPNRG